MVATGDDGAPRDLERPCLAFLAQPIARKTEVLVAFRHDLGIFDDTDCGGVVDAEWSG